MGPPDGRYLVRSAGKEDPDAVLVLGTLGTLPRRFLQRKRGEVVEESRPEPVPTARATLVRPAPFASGSEAVSWLDEIRRNEDLRERELDSACRTLNRAMHAHRVALADPYTPELTPDKALVARIGYGAGTALAEGEYEAAWELESTAPRKPRRSMETPDERFAALLGGRTNALAAEELVLRARADLGAGRVREAALQARVALEALLAELPDQGPLARARGDLEADRGPIGDAANAALRGDPGAVLAMALAEAVERMEAILRRHRLGA